VTGADGFAGCHLLERLGDLACPARPASRRTVGDINEHTDWRSALEGADAVVHLAARAHVLRETPDGADRYRQTNILGALNLFRQAREAGVRRFIFVSSAGVHGRQGLDRGHPGNEDSPLNPEDLYARAKAEAEAGLRDLAREGRTELVILRPVLMFGPGVKGNLRRLMSLITKGRPWPLAGADNRRSFLNVRNFVDFAIRCLDDPRAAGETFVLADEPDISTPELLTGLGRALGVRVRLWPCPPGLLKLGAAALGRGKAASQLLDDLCFDSARARTLLDWRPPYRLDQSFQEMADRFRQTQAAR
jgi:nucleoside-diphosphate-sugar epimerase